MPPQPIHIPGNFRLTSVTPDDDENGWPMGIRLMFCIGRDHLKIL